MIPKRPPSIPPRPVKRKLKLQPNRLFDDEKELKEWVKQNHPTARILKMWPVKQLACEIEL